MVALSVWSILFWSHFFPKQESRCRWPKKDSRTALILFYWGLSSCHSVHILTKKWLLIYTLADLEYSRCSCHKHGANAAVLNGTDVNCPRCVAVDAAVCCKKLCQCRLVELGVQCVAVSLQGLNDLDLTYALFNPSALLFSTFYCQLCFFYSFFSFSISGVKRTPQKSNILKRCSAPPASLRTSWTAETLTRGPAVTAGGQTDHRGFIL